jgi:Flp pilus assembly protein TadD
LVLAQINSDVFAPIDRWSRLDFQQLVDEARQSYAAGDLHRTHTICLVGLSRFPDSAPLLSVLGWVLARRSDLANAETAFRTALCREPCSADSQAGLADVLAARERFDAAAVHYQRALELAPCDAQTLFNFGCSLIALRRFDPAIEVLERSARLDPTHADTLHNLAIAHAQLGRWQEADQLCTKALALDPSAWKARLLRGMSRVALGAFADGWDDYEARCQGQEYYTCRLDLPRWRGPADVRQSIAVVPEQGIGTQLLFASCVADVGGHVPHVTLGCESRLVGILRRALPTTHVVAAGLLPELARSGLFDAYVMAGSLPSIFRRSAESFPGTRYLAPDPIVQVRWRERLAALGHGFKVGVSWGGGAGAPDASHRRTELRNWKSLASLDHVQWINLQYDATPDELEQWRRLAGERFHDWIDLDKKHDLENLAGLVSELDLAITVVNSKVHLAGGLGTPTWALIPRGGEWRWQTSGRSCHWHQSVRLFRQQRPDDWSDVFAELQAELAVFPRSNRRERRDRAA